MSRLRAGGACLVAAIAVMQLVGGVGPAVSADCGGLLQPRCPPLPPPYPPAPDPGGDENANLSVPPPAGLRFGFNSNLWWQTAGGQDLVPLEVGRSAQAGAQILRTSVSWASLASAPGKPLGNEGDSPRGSVANPSALKQLDELYDRATATGLQLDLVITSAPRWASAYWYCKRNALGQYPSGCGPVAKGKRLYPTGSHLQDLSDFVGALGARYPGVIFETWNEPNLDRGPQAVSGAFIGQMQCAVWSAAKALPAPSMVLSAGFGVFYGETSTRQYLDGFYSTGGSCFDRLAVHTYNGWSGSFGADSPLAGHMKVYRDARDAAGDTRPMWVTEFGFSTAHDDGRVDETDQDAFTWREYNKLLTMPDVEAAIVHTLRDAPVPAYTKNNDLEYGYGWLRRDWSPKPVYCDFSARAGTPAC